MSPVAGFEAAERGFFERVAAQGVERMAANAAAELLD